MMFFMALCKACISFDNNSSCRGSIRSDHILDKSQRSVLNYEMRSNLVRTSWTSVAKSGNTPLFLKEIETSSQIVNDSQTSHASEEIAIASAIISNPASILRTFLNFTTSTSRLEIFNIRSARSGLLIDETVGSLSRYRDLVV